MELLHQLLLTRMVKELAVARFRSSMRPIHRIKHVVDIQTAIPVNVKIENNLIATVDAPVISSVTQVETGSRVNGIFLTVEAVASETSTTATPNLYLAVYKNPGNNLTFPNANAVGTDDNKRFVIHQEMVMINALDGGSPRNVFKGVIVIPKHLQRMGPFDTLELQLFIPSTGVAINACAQCHYKEFR